MYMECRHIKTNGLRCESPALRGGQFCYYHAKVHTIGAEPNLKFGPLQLPVPEDAAAIQLSVARISDAIINDRISLKKATALLYGLQIAAQFVDRKKPIDEAETVQSAEQTVQGDELAPGVYVCKGEDCNQCPFSNPGQCTRWTYTATNSQLLDRSGEEDENEADDDRDGEEDNAGDDGVKTDDDRANEEGDIDGDEIEEADGGGGADDDGGGDADGSEEAEEGKTGNGAGGGGGGEEGERAA